MGEITQLEPVGWYYRHENVVLIKVHEKGNQNKGREKKRAPSRKGISATMGDVELELNVPGSTRELEFVRVREIESMRGRISGPPDCLRVRGTGVADRWCPFVEFERERSRSFMADRSGLLVLAVLECLRVFGCGV